jgi:acetylornithine deacetylase
VAEPTRLDLVHSHKGAVRWKARTRGVACHSSTPQLGDNAIYRMAPVVGALAEYAERLARSAPDPILGPPSLSVGRIEGGQSVNVVPDWCELEIDRRVIPGEVPADCPGQVLAFLRERLGAAGVPGLPPPLGQHAGALPAGLGDLGRGVAARDRGVIGRPRRHRRPYGPTPAPHRAGTRRWSSVPATSPRPHQDEWVDLDEVRLAVDVYYQIACAWAEPAPRFGRPQHSNRFLGAGHSDGARRPLTLSSSG